jgi:hypothetical protein
LLLVIDIPTKTHYIGNMEKMKQHVISRNVDLNLHTVWFDDDNRIAVFPLWNLSKEFVGYQAYRPDADKTTRNDEKGRYHTYRGVKLFPRHCKTVAVWGLESWYLTNTLFVTEGIFDAARLTQLGVSAAAVLSNDPSTSTKNWFLAVRQTRPVVAVCDPGRAGAKLAKLGHLSHVVTLPNNADLGDAPLDYVTNLVAKYANL